MNPNILIDIEELDLDLNIWHVAKSRIVTRVLYTYLSIDIFVF